MNLVKIFKVFVLMLMVFSVLSCNYFSNEDTHPEIPFLETIVKNEKLFEPIYKVDSTRYEFDFILLNNNRFLTVYHYLEDIKPDVKPNKNEKNFVDHLSMYEIELRDFENKLLLKKVIQVNGRNLNILIDSNANLYLDDYNYTAPNYQLKEKMTMINIPREILMNQIDRGRNHNIDSLNASHLLTLERKYDFTFSNDKKYIFQNEMIIFLSEEIAINEAEAKMNDFETFDKAILTEIRNVSRDVPKSFYYYYLKFGQIKFKYSDAKLGGELPKFIVSNKKTYLFHPTLGIFRIKN